MARRTRSKVNAKGRNANEQYLVVPYSMAKSAAWRSLSGPAVKVWIEVRSRYNGANNGRLVLSLEEAARLLGLGKTTVQRALQELEAKGFLERTKQGCWYGRQASEYAVCDKGVNTAPPTNAWRNWQPKQKAANENPKRTQRAVAKRSTAT